MIRFPGKAAAACGAVVLLASAADAAQAPPAALPPLPLTEREYVLDTAEQHRLRVVVLARGLKRPFSLALLPDGEALVSERGGNLRRVTGATGAAPRLDPAAVAGLPESSPRVRYGGLHDLAPHPDFANNRLVFFTFNRTGRTLPAEGDRPETVTGILTVLRARYADGRLTEVRELYAAGEGNPSFAPGSRLALDGAGHVYVTTGAPFGGYSQDLSSAYGKVLRLREDGGIPADNPFAGLTGARPEVYSLGHRDQLGLAVHAGRVFSAEHGPNGGDEVNLIRPGRNYGWPRVTFGRGYDGAALAESPVAAGMEPPMLTWVPSIGPTGLQFYTGDRFPAWKGNLFVGSVRRGQIPGTGGLERVVLNERFEELRRETLLTGLRQRIRDVRQGPDGLLYLLTDEDDGALLRLEPAP